MTQLQETKDIKNSGIFYKYALVLVDAPKLGTRTFSYLIPEEIKKSIKIGSPVLVPFGNQNNINAFVVGFTNYLEEGIKAKYILELLDEKEVFDLNYLKLMEWVSNYYGCDLNTVLQAAIPMKFLKQTKRMLTRTDKKFNETEDKLNKYDLKILNSLNPEKPLTSAYIQKIAKISYSQFYKSTRKLKDKGYIKIENILNEKVQKTQTEKIIKFIKNDGANKRQLEILEKLEELKEAKLIEFEQEIKTTRATIKKLEQEGFVEIIKEEVYRNPLSIFKVDKLENFPQLNEEQKSAFKTISKKIDKKQVEPILLYGVTASGKTEVYFNAIKKVLAEGKNVLFLAPEIALASQLTHRLTKRFGIENVAIWHSSISDGERYDVWQKLRNNEIKILAGARSAVFAPLKNIGLIIIDEEHENTYKQTTPAPRYNAKTIAEKIAKESGATLIIGSATPDICSFYKANNSDNLIELKSRFNNAPLAKVNIVDMRQEYNKDNRSTFSRILIREIEKNLEEKKQTLLLINRRGFSTHTQCVICGEVIKCEKCDIPMIWHATDQKLKCHWCAEETEFPKKCPKCGAKEIQSFGLGTQRVEKILQKFFPTANIKRLDSDVTSKKNASINILKEFEDGTIDILIGTQMIAKGLDNPNVTIVGVISADASFNLPDFRASERGFQLLTQVAGRTGRGNLTGNVYFQTYNPDFYAIETAREQNYEKFYKEEIISREMFDYPPFSQIIKILITSKNQYRAEKSAQEIALRLNEIINKSGVEERLILQGPTHCILEKINNEYRFQILIKNKMDKKGHFFISSFVSKISMPEDIKLIMDIDPIDIL